MKKLALVALLGALTCVPVLAQEAPNPPDGPPAPPPGMKAMMQARSDTRAAMLNALSPEHKQLLASIAGQLAIAPNPDYDAAAKQLDAALTPAEKTAITAAEQASRDKMEAAMKNMRPPGGDGNQTFGPVSGGGNRVFRRASMTPGSTLLHTAMGGGPVMFMTTSMEAHP